MRLTVRLVLVLACLAMLVPLVAAALEVECETYTLPNGLTVILHEDHTLPQVVVDTWYHVGSKDDPPGRSGFAHLFEHLMFMGTERAPDSSYDDIMEAGGGANNAGTGMDQTVYYSWGPSSLLPTLLWLDADRLDGLGQAMTQSKLDLQREVVLNERRQNYENAPYGVAAFLIPEALYPEGHPYRSSGIGEPAQLEAATLEDVVSFFDAYYVPANASLVVAGDFDPETVKPLIARTFGAVPARPPGPHRTAGPVVLEREQRRVTTDRVEAPKLFLVWLSPPAYHPGDAEMDLIADILGDGPSSRLHQRLIVRDRTAREIEVYQGSQLLSSEFHIEVTAVAGSDLEQIKRAVLEELATFAAAGPSGGELERVKAATEASFLRGMEDLRARADSLNEYRFHFGEPDAFARDLARYTSVDGDGLRRWAAQVFDEGRLDLRVLPLDASVEDASLDQRPADFPQPSHQPPLPERFTLGNGIPVDLVSRPRSGLFQGALVVEGGERVVSAAQAGLASLTATMLTAGAGGRSAAELADAIDSLGARVRASASEHETTVTVRGLASRLSPTLDLFADAVLRPNLLADDFERERNLAVEDIRSRAEDPRTVAFLSSSSLLFDRDNPFGRPADGYLDTVGALTLDDVRTALPRLIDPGRARFVFVGDVDAVTLRTELERRFGAWSAPPSTLAGLPEVAVKAVCPADRAHRPAGRTADRDPARPAGSGSRRRARAGDEGVPQHALRLDLHQPVEPQPARGARLHLRSRERVHAASRPARALRLVVGSIRGHGCGSGRVPERVPGARLGERDRRRARQGGADAPLRAHQHRRDHRVARRHPDRARCRRPAPRRDRHRAREPRPGRARRGQRDGPLRTLRLGFAAGRAGRGCRLPDRSARSGGLPASRAEPWS